MYTKHNTDAVKNFKNICYLGRKLINLGMLIPILIGVFFVFMQIAIVWTMFNIRQHTEKQTALHVAQIRLLAKIARNTGTPDIEVNEVLSSTGNKL